MGRERERKRKMDKKGERRYRVWKRQMERMVEVREENCEDGVTATRPAKGGYYTRREEEKRRAITRCPHLPLVQRAVLIS